MSELGHVKMSRKAYAPIVAGGDPFWNEPRVFSRWEAWEYLIQTAAYADHRRMAGGGPVMIPRGHTPPLSLSYLATAWRWSTKKVRVYLETLVEMDRIRAVGGDRNGTTYLLLNYDYYQSSPQAKYEEGHDEGTQKGTVRGIAKGTANPSNNAGSGALRAQSGARSGDGSDRSKGQQIEALEANNKLLGGANAPAATKRATQLADDWEPNASHRDRAASLSLDVDEEAERFRDFHLAKGNVMKDWDRAFNTWLRNAPRFSGGRTVPAVTLDAGVWVA